MKGTSWRRAAAAALAAGLLVAACGGSSESPAASSELTTDPVTLTIQIYNAGGQAELEYRQAQGADFTALHPNVTIKIVQSSEYIDALLPQVVAGTAGDVLWTDTDTGFTQFAVAGAFESNAFAFGVTHAPYKRVLQSFETDKADLVLAGHTHGGQICIPFYGALVTNCDLPQGQAKGYSTFGESKMPLHVSAGVGTSPFAQVRIACRPEATLITLSAKRS